MDADTAKVATIILVGALMIIYVTVGGMKGTTYVQIVKAFLLMAGAMLMTVLVLAQYKFNLSALLGDAAADRPARAAPSSSRGCGTAWRWPGNALQTFYNKMDLLSPRHRPGARHRRPAAHPDPVLHGAHRQGRPQERALGDRHHRHLLPVHPGARLRRGGAGRRRGDHRAGQGRQHGGAAAGRRRSAIEFLGGDTAARPCSRSSRRSRSRPSSPWSPGSPWPPRRASRTTSTPT